MTTRTTAKRGDKQINLRIPKQLEEKVKARASKHGRSRNTEILFLIEDGLKKAAKAAA